MKPKDFQQEKALGRWANEGGATLSVSRSERSNQENLGDHRSAIKRFAAAWVNANIFPGPFTQNDAPVYNDVIADFLAKALAKGYSAEAMDHVLGGVRTFMHRSYDDANRRWQADVDK